MHTNAGAVPSPGPQAPSPRPGVWLTDVTLMLMALIWGSNFVVMKFATGIMPPLAFNALRVSLAAVTLLIIAVLSKGPWPTRRQTLALMGLGVLGNGIYQILFVEGVALTRVADAALLIAATPAFIALLGRIRGVERIGGKGWIGILLSILGISLVSGAAFLVGTGGSILGDLMILFGSLCWAVYTVMLKPYMDDVNGTKLAALTMTGGAITLLAVAWRGILDVSWAAAPAAAWAAMVYSGIGALVIAYFFWYRGVRIIGPTRTAMYSNVQPVFAVFIAWLFLGDVPTVWQGVGAASIMSGLFLART